MRYIVDTNIIIRLKTDISLISKDVAAIITDTENRIYASAVSVQEIYILMQSAKIHVKEWKSPHDVFDYIEKELGFSINYVKKEHLLFFGSIIPVEGHGDPFDRMIIAQAVVEQIPMISSDAKFRYYRKIKLDFILNDG